jgi:hypothetical protein
LRYLRDHVMLECRLKDTMRRIQTRLLIIACMLVAFVGHSWADNTYPLRKNVKLEALGGAAFKVPDWTISGPQKENLVVLKTNKVKGPEGFFILMVTIEKGPKGPVDWKKVANNTKAAAKKRGARLTLKVGANWTGLAGATGKEMSGTLKSKGQLMVVNLLSLVKSGRLVTVAVLCSKQSKVAKRLVESVARSTKILGP